MVVASDCKSVIEDIQIGVGGLHGNIIKEIQASVADFAAVSFIHEGRALNTEADSLAKHTVNLDTGRHLWLLQPPGELHIHVNIYVER